nr:cytochrome c oxidase subunit 2, mitochondrial [Tanacetum cinerariifolium]GEY52206.1 cytochrome c oxidase subunit 2, mitochondrial [Tanacetum cinerariifolium]
MDNRVVVPAKSHLRIIVTSADVLHSWAVPSSGVKCDAVPGRLNQISISVQREGVYYGPLPNNTQPNPKGHNFKAYQPPQSHNEHANAIFIRSGKSYNPPVNPKDQQNDSENPICNTPKLDHSGGYDEQNMEGMGKLECVSRFVRVS